ncbi:glycosyltransferase family 2 protein [Clostridiaceae bacterium]|nr:glycosyltransferase family 2 protein [Clostridium sp.]NBI71482.1 glycosyltransferase family 2 protein [Clostridiaceae bacterium]
MNELISIVMPVYNSERFLSEAIESVQRQTYKNWELILVDDASTDNSAGIIEAFSKGENRIKYILLSENRGAAYTRNRAVREAKGEYIAFLDSDDRWLPEKLERQYHFMKDNQILFSCTSYEQLDETGKPTGRIIRPPQRADYKMALWENPVGTLSAMYNAEKLGKVYGPLIRKRNDYALWLKLLKKVRYVYGLDETLAQYRLRKNSLSRNKMSLITYQWKLYREIENLPRIWAAVHVGYTMGLKIKRTCRLWLACERQQGNYRINDAG